jgi:hypothetical protein
MASNEGHIHWSGSADETVTYLDQELQMTSEVSNAQIEPEDPIGTVRIRLNGSVETGLALPNSTASAPVWSAVPDTLPILEVRVDGHYPVGYIRIRQA